MKRGKGRIGKDRNRKEMKRDGRKQMKRKGRETKGKKKEEEVRKGWK